MSEELTKYSFRDGDLILVHNYFDLKVTTPLALLIQLLTRSYYHHCAIYYNGFIYESTAKGVCLTHNLNEYLSGVGSTREIALCRFPSFDKSQIFELYNKKYNFVALFWQFWKQITNKYHGEMNPKRYTCSQFAAKVLGYENWAEIDPQDLWSDSCINGLVVWETAKKRRQYVNDKLN
jgi:hypothetical protein